MCDIETTRQPLLEPDPAKAKKEVEVRMQETNSTQQGQSRAVRGMAVNRAGKKEDSRSEG